MSTSIDVSYSNEIFRQYLLQISSDIIWKNLTLASEKESQELNDAYNAELFIAANRNLLNFDIIKAFPKAVLSNGGITDSSLDVYASDKRKIPENLRTSLVKEYTIALTSKDPITGHYGYLDKRYNKYVVIYQEVNDYYRMLMGLPDVLDNDYIYNTDSRWSTTTPIHMMSTIDRIEMENFGVLSELIKKYPSKKYLEFVGKKSIDFFNARVADRFEILYKTPSPSSALNDDFTEAYNRSRYLVNAVYYSEAYKKTNALYENFLAMAILFMSIQHMQHLYLKVDIGRDFYDADSLKFVYASYEVPFYNEIPLDYHKRIVKNINQLISYKGSSQVFFDLFQIFDLGHMDIYSYFLTKVHAMNSEGMPIFNYEYDDEGNIQYDVNGNPILASSSYDIKFSKVKIYDDPALSISNPANDLAYSAITEPDPYWINDAELQKKLADESFNYLETKYIGIQTIFDLVKITYENAYVFRMIMDNKDITSLQVVNWTELGVQCSVFDVFIYMCALYCRFYKYEGLINTKIPAIMNTLGYNFEESTSIITNIVNPNQYLSSNNQLVTLLNSLTTSAFDTPTNVYSRIQDAISLITNGMINATSREEFFAYKSLYDSILVSKELTRVYTNPENGEVFETFVDMLTYYSPDLMQRYLLLQDEAIADEITLCISRMEKIVEGLRYSSLAAGLGTSTMIDSLFKILTFFKSAKAELIGYNVVYTITQRGTNFFKMMDRATQWTTASDDIDELPLNDLINRSQELIHLQSELLMLRQYEIASEHLSSLDKVIQVLQDKIYKYTFTTSHTFIETMYPADIFQPVSQSSKIKSSMMCLTDSAAELIKLVSNADHVAMSIGHDIATMKDSITRIPISAELVFKNSHLIIDKIKSITCKVGDENDSYKDTNIFKDRLIVLSESIEKVSDILHPSDKFIDKSPFNIPQQIS